MSDLFGNHIVGFPTRRLRYCNEKSQQNCLGMVSKESTVTVRGLKSPIDLYPCPLVCYDFITKHDHVELSQMEKMKILLEKF